MLVYSLFWLAGAVCIFLVFKFNQKSFLFVSDGIYQHYVSFDYLCDYVNALFVHHRPLGSFNFTLGQGLDILTTLSSYDFTDPVSLIASLIIPLSRYQRYVLMVFIKLYLVGLSFCYYCASKELKPLWAVLSGALTYTFSGAVLFTFARHPNFISWAYFFPFLLGALESYRTRNRRLPLILLCFLSALTNYYTFYMNAVLVAGYSIVNSLCRLKKQTLKNDIIREALFSVKVIFLCLTGVFLASFILFPIVYAYLTNTRFSQGAGQTVSLWHYTHLSYYKKLLAAMFTPQYSAGRYTYLGLSPMVFIPGCLLFLKSKKETALKILMLAGFIMLCLPAAGRLMNGFGYPCNRWSYALVFCFSLALVYVIPSIYSITSKRSLIMIVSLAGLYSGINLFLNPDNLQIKVSMLLLLTAVLISALFIVIIKADRAAASLRLFMPCLVMICAFCQISFTFSPRITHYLNRFLDRGSVTSCFTDYSVAAASGLDDGFYRVEGADTMPNKEGVLGINGTNAWWSLMPASVYDYYNGLSLNTVLQNCYFDGLDGRTALLELASVKYYTKPAADSSPVPYGFEEIRSPKPDCRIYENRFALPIGYTYSGYILAEEYSALSAPGREAAMLQAAVLDAPLPSYEHLSIESDLQEIPYTITCENNLVLSENSISAKASSSFSLEAGTTGEGELCLCLNGIELNGPKSEADIVVTRQRPDFTITKQAKISNSHYNWPVTRDSVVFNLGYSGSGKDSITVTFNQEADFIIDSIELIQIPMNAYHFHTEALNQYPFENISVDQNTVSGSIDLPERRLLQFSIPYSKGWTATVDGLKAPVYKSDIMYMALLLEPGQHEITLAYETPYLRAGIYVSLLTLMIICLIRLISKKNPPRTREVRTGSEAVKSVGGDTSDERSPALVG